MAARPTVRVVLPIGPQQQANRELELAKWLASGKHVQGGIFFTSRDMKFMFINIAGDTEVPLYEQVPDLRSHDRDLGLKRNITHSISFVKSNPPTYARLFVRVLSGCSELQINAACQFLNGKLDWQIKTFPGHMETYEKLVPICRDILHPEFRYFTRHNRTKPYMWNPLVPSPDGAIPTLGELIHNGSHAIAVDMESPTKHGQWPDVPLVRRTDSGTMHHVADVGASGAAAAAECPEQSYQKSAVANTSSSVPQVDGGHSGNMSGSSDLPEDQPEKGNATASEILAVVDNALTGAETRAKAPEVNVIKAVDEDPLPPYSESESDHDEVEGDTDDIMEVPSQSQEDESSDADDENLGENLGTENVVNQGDCAVNERNESTTAAKSATATEQGSGSEDVPEQILSGNLDVPGVKQVTVDDDRPVTLRRLHQALPKNKEAIPDGIKQKVAFSMLVLQIRKLEVEYNESRQVDGDLEELDEGKLLNKRQVKRELKHILELMTQRDIWESNHRIRQAKAVVNTRKKKSTILGRKKEAEKFVHVQRQRLIENAALDKSSSLDLDVERGPRAAGLDGFPMFRRQKKQMQEYKQKNKKYKEKRRELNRNESTTSSSGSVKPLHKVLEKQSRALHGASLRALANDDILKEINDTRHSIDKPSGSGKSKKSKKSNPALSDDLSQDGLIGQDQSFAVPTVPRGYVKADTLTLMKEVYKQQAALLTTTEEKFKSIKGQVLNMSNEQRKSSKMLGKNSSNIKKLQSAFFDYDLQTHHELCDVENEFLKLLPVDELGPRTDFIFSEPAFAKTIAKKVFHDLTMEGHHSPTLTQLVNETARLCFSTHLRAHLHIVKRQWKDNVGWYKVKCPVSYQTMMEKYILSGLSSMGNFSKGWKTILYGHFKNFGETYMSCQCKKAKSQRDFVLARRLERISLQRRHFDADREGRELIVPTVEEELNSYGKHSEYFEDGNDLNKSQDEKSQKAKKKLPDEDKIYEPLPCLEALVELSRRLKSALSASVAGQRSKKQSLAIEDTKRKSPKGKARLSTTSSSSSSSSAASSSSSSSSSDSEEEMAKKKKKKKRKESKVKPLKIVVGKKRKKPSTLTDSSESSSDDHDDDDDESSVDEMTFRKHLNVENTSSQALDQAGPSPSAQNPPPKGKPKAFALMMASQSKASKKKASKAKKRKW